MGNQASSESDIIKQEAASTVHVALMGLTETGKSHFINVLSNDSTSKRTERPTNGTERAVISYRSKKIAFTEFGSRIGQLWAHELQQDPYTCVMWFIDEHDTAEDILVARNRMHHACLNSPGKHDIPLCVVFNMGRPRIKRRDIYAELSTLAWKDPTLPAFVPSKGGIVGWDMLSGVMDLRFLEAAHRSVYVTQLSYNDGETPIFLMDWVLSCCKG